jgi:hypothetical protein
MFLTLPYEILPAYSINSNVSLFVNDLVCNDVPASVNCHHSVKFMNKNNSVFVINNIIDNVGHVDTIAYVPVYCSENFTCKLFELDKHCYYDRAFKDFFNAFIKCDSRVYNVYRDLGLLCNVQRLYNTNYQSFLMYNYCKCYLSGLFSF